MTFTADRLRAVRLRAWPLRQLSGQLAGLVLVALSLAFLYWPVTRWTIDKFLLSTTHWHWYVAAIAIACAVRSNKQRLAPGVNNLATSLLLLCTAAEVVNQLTLQIQLLSAVLLILTLHACTGHLIHKTRWVATQWPIVVGIAVLPLDFYLEPYFGYPLRLFSASVASVVIQGVGFEALSSQSILLVENRASVVDLDCSGINSLWAGVVFYLLLSWLTRLAVGFQWWLLCVGLVVLLLCSNVFRIVVLVVLDVADLPGYSEIAHTALSALGFTMAILVVWKYAEKLPKSGEPNQGTDQCIKPLTWRWPLLPLIVVILISAAVAPDNRVDIAQEERLITLPVALKARPIALRSQERKFFQISGAQAQKYQLGPEQQKSSVVLVNSNWWKAQHKPEHCLQAMGMIILNDRVVTIGSEKNADGIKTVAVLDLLDVDQQAYTAIYWFQSAEVITADHHQRMADSFFNRDRSWTMVSMLLGGVATSSQITGLADPIRKAVNDSYKEKM